MALTFPSGWVRTQTQLLKKCISRPSVEIPRPVYTLTRTRPPPSLCPSLYTLVSGKTRGGLAVAFAECCFLTVALLLAVEARL